MTVGGLHGVPVCPVALGHVRKGSKLTDMAADIGLIRAAFQQTAGDRRYLGAGDGELRLKGSVLIAGDPAAGGCKVDGNSDSASTEGR